MTELTHKNLRKLDDTDCTNVITTRNINRLINKYSNLSNIKVNCWVHEKHYTQFDLENNKFKWTDTKGGSILNSSDDLSSEELNKLLVHTYRNMCDTLSDNVAFIDTPEDILLYAEQKLRSLIDDEKVPDVIVDECLPDCDNEISLDECIENEYLADEQSTD